MEDFQKIAGMHVIIRPAEPEVSFVRRSWAKRLLELPWHPFVARKSIDHPDAVKRNKEIWQTGNTLHMTPQMENMVRRELAG